MAWFRRKRQPNSKQGAYSPTLPSLHVERRYRDDVPYMLPKDIGEINRLDFQHFVLRHTLHANYLAPIAQKAPPQSILDVGCGTGIWCYELCREFSQAQVYGLDLEVVPKPEVPPNYHFVEGNLLNGLPFARNTFDFVHQRFLIAALPATAWPMVIRQLIDVTRPGGWIELVEAGGDHFSPDGPVSSRFADEVIKIAAIRGIDTRLMRSLGSMLELAGLLNVEKRTFLLPVGKWGGRVGTLMGTDLEIVLKSFKDAFIKVLRYSPEEFDKIHATMMQEWEQYHSNYPIYLYYGQKP